MAYTKQTWTNDDPATPLSGARLSHMEDGIEDAHEAVDGISFSDISGTATAAQVPTLAISKVSGLQSALDDKADDGDLAGLASTAALTSGLAGKADTTHTHTIAQVTSLQSALDAITDRLDALEQV